MQTTGIGLPLSEAETGTEFTLLVDTGHNHGIVICMHNLAGCQRTYPVMEYQRYHLELQAIDMELTVCSGPGSSYLRFPYMGTPPMGELRAKIPSYPYGRGA